MKLDELKTGWSTAVADEKTEAALLAMVQKGSNPTLRKIKLQAGIELAGWAVFLLMCFMVLDVAEKPLLAQVLLLAAFLLAMLVNILIYRQAKGPIAVDAIRHSVAQFLRKVKQLAYVSVMARLLLLCALVLFFTGNITFTEGKYWALVAIGVIFTAQMMLYMQLWTRRLHGLRKTLLFFDKP